MAGIGMPGPGAGGAPPGPPQPGAGPPSQPMGGIASPGMSSPFPAPSAPPPAPFTDLSSSLPPHWQLLDVSASTIKQAIETGGFYKSPATLAAIREIHSDLEKLIAAAVRGNRPEMEAPATHPEVSIEEPSEDIDAETPTADSEPLAAS